MFSVCVCAWNDLPYLKILHRGLRRNTRVPYELIVHDNGSTDGTGAWLTENGIKHTRSAVNEGVAAVNYAVERAQYGFIVDINADMYPLPGWDAEVVQQREAFAQQGVAQYTISSCLIEPVGNNPECTIRDHGRDAAAFDEESLLQDYQDHAAVYKKPSVIQYSHPVMMPKKLWDAFGGVDEAYFPGYSSDHDIAASAYQAGCRHFIRLGSCRTYHFVGKTLGKLEAGLKAKNGEDIFRRKWGMQVDEFRRRLGVSAPYRPAPEGVLTAYAG